MPQYRRHEKQHSKVLIKINFEVHNSDGTITNHLEGSTGKIIAMYLTQNQYKMLRKTIGQ